MRNKIEVGYAFVVCDLLHIGHLKLFQNCKKYCDFLIVGVYTDELTMSYKRKPIIPFEDRIELVESLRPVDMVVKVENKDATPMLKKLREEGWDVKFLFHGNDWKPEEIKGKDYIESIGGELILLPYYKPMNTTWIIDEILRREKN